MSGERPAALDRSLFAQKGAAAPAIPDESPLVLHLEEHRPKPAGPGPEGERQDAIADSAGIAGDGLGQEPARTGLNSSRVRLAAIAVAAVLVIAFFFFVGLSNDSSETLPDRVDRTPDAEPVVEADNQGLQLNLKTAAEAPAPQSEQPEQAITPKQQGATVALPAAAALAIAATPEDETAAAEPATTGGDAAPASGSVIPVNVPSRETAPPQGDVDSAPKIPATVPKSVSPVPIPKPRPDLAAIPAARYAVQLASITVEKRATQEAFRLQKQLGQILGGREIIVEKARVAGKGTRYRLRASGYPTQAEASAACSQIVRLKVDCLAIRR